MNKIGGPYNKFFGLFGFETFEASRRSQRPQLVQLRDQGSSSFRLSYTLDVKRTA